MQGEYRGDFTRDTFYRANHFCRVLMQQGRVQLDADWNEQTAILLHFLRSLGRDLIGQHGGPGPFPGFGINLISGLTGDFQIGAGNYYVDGILCELNPQAVPVRITEDVTLEVNAPLLDGLPFQVGQYLEVFDPSGLIPSRVVKIATVTSGTVVDVASNPGPPANITDPMLRRVLTYLTQPDYPAAETQGIPVLTPPAGQFLVYLDVWERHLTYTQDNRIHEVALGNADTASRAKVLWQVKATSQLPQPFPASPANLPADDQKWRDFVIANFQPDNRGLLKAQVQPQQTSTDPCVMSPESSYRGAENQLYRVEIHNGGALGTLTPGRADVAPGTIPSPTPPTGPSFKWSRENGSVIFPILKLGTSAGQTTITLANLGRDSNLSLQINDWVEVVDDGSALSGSVDLLLQVQSIDPVNLVVTLAGTSAIVVDQPPTKNPILRRWDGIGAISESNGGQPTDWLTLEDGIQIQFQPPGPGMLAAQYRSGDYWLIPARVATGNIEWPEQRDAQGQIVPDPTTNLPVPDSLPPHGVEHHYAPLALIAVDATGTITGSRTELRRIFGPIATPMI